LAKVSAHSPLPAAPHHHAGRDTTMAGRLQGKVAMITGAGSVGAGWGNGRAAAVLFAQEGALVFGVDRNLASMEETAERIRESGGRFATAECDVTDAASVA
jgi:NAD(P)-dependent dehydrogenase (short-subunit alcohol dehydrogenase family)